MVGAAVEVVISDAVPFTESLADSSVACEGEGRIVTSSVACEVDSLSTSVELANEVRLKSISIDVVTPSLDIGVEDATSVMLPSVAGLETSTVKSPVASVEVSKRLVAAFVESDEPGDDVMPISTDVMSLVVAAGSSTCTVVGEPAPKFIVESRVDSVWETAISVRAPVSVTTADVTASRAVVST